MVDTAAAINDRIASRVRELRAERGLSLDALAARCGVSRSMISLIERGESSPTAVVLEKLAAGLDVTMPALFEEERRQGVPGVRAPKARPENNGPVSRREDQPEWKDPASGYRRRNITPRGVPQPMQIVEVHFPAGARIAFELGSRATPVYQQVWVLEGAMDIGVGPERHRLRAGDCLAMQLDQATMFHNPTRKPARYAVVIASDSGARR